MLRADESNTLEKALGLKITKKSSYFERIRFSSQKKDPFENKVKNDTWKIVGNKLLKKKS